MHVSLSNRSAWKNNLVMFYNTINIFFNALVIIIIIIAIIINSNDNNFIVIIFIINDFNRLTLQIISKFFISYFISNYLQ